MNEIGEDFEALCVTISSIYDLRGIGVQAAYVSDALWNWMREAEDRKNGGSYWRTGEQRYNEVNVEWKTTKTGALRLTIWPYGSDHAIPVKPKYSGKKPWKIVVTYRED